MAETPSAAAGMTDRELLVDVWEIVAGLEQTVTRLEGKVTELEDEFGPVARRYRRLALPLGGRASANGHKHGN
jgi:hypothetical protein